MLLPGALFALFMTGFWLYGLTDAVLTPARECRGLAKTTWIVVIAMTFGCGAVAWLIVRRRTRAKSAPLAGTLPWEQAPLADGERFRHAGTWDPGEACWHHPAGRARLTGPGRVAPAGPDDDPEFLRALGRAIRGNSHQAGEEI
jgi:hypothetical protein